MKAPTQAFVRALLEYNPDSGLFFWRKRPETTPANKAFNARFAGREAGANAYNTHGYKQIRIKGELYVAHRLAYLYMTGIWADEVDHANRIVSDNRFSNLRQATRSQNCANRKPTSATGFRGVTREGNKFRAQGGPRNMSGRYIGMFNTAEEASAAYEATLSKVYGDFLFRVSGE